MFQKILEGYVLEKLCVCSRKINNDTKGPRLLQKVIRWLLGRLLDLYSLNYQKLTVSVELNAVKICQLSFTTIFKKNSTFYTIFKYY